MSKVNVKSKSNLYTHEGTPACNLNPEQMLRRSVCSCLLWENEFYEDGISISNRIAELIPKVAPEKVAQLAIQAREEFKLRHVPLFIVREMARYEQHSKLVKTTLERIIQRADELSEFMAIYWKDKRQPISNQVKKGLAKAFNKFNEYQLAKYNRDSAIKLRDVLFLCHAKPKDAEQEALWKRLVDNELTVPDTWEVSLSAGKNKKDTWERLLKSNKLGALALLRNLRNMEGVGVDNDLIKSAIEKMDVSRVLPFRFITAAKYAMHFEPELEKAMMNSFEKNTKLPGKTIIIVDVSGSMYGRNVSEKSEIDRAKAACILATIGREFCENVRVYATAGNDWTRKHQTQEVPSRRGFGLIDVIYGLCKPLGGGGIFLTPVIDWIKEKEKDADRIIVITDEQDCAGAGENAPSHARPFGKYNYILNVGSYNRSIGFGKWTNISGFSESIFNYIFASEGNK